MLLLPSRVKVALACVLLVLPAVAMLGPAQAAPNPTEGLTNGSMEGAPGSGYTLEHAADIAAIAKHGAQSVNLARAGSAPQSDLTLGQVTLATAHAIPLKTLGSLTWSHRLTQTPSASIWLDHRISLDTTGDGTRDECLVHTATTPLTLTDGWVTTVFDANAAYTKGGPTCAPGGPATTLAEAIADATLGNMQIQNVALRTRTASPDAWGLAAVYVDDAHVSALASPLIRIKESAKNLCNGASFSDIPSALECAANGATILVAPGTYTGSITVAKPVTLCATRPGDVVCRDNYWDVILRGTTATTVTLAANSVTLRGFVIENPNYADTDQTLGAPATPTLVKASGNDLTLRSLTLRNPATALLAGQSRALTLGVHVTSGSLSMEFVNINTMTSSVGPDGTCLHAPCRTVGIVIGENVTSAFVNANNLHLLGTRRAAGIDVQASAIRVSSNTIYLPTDNGGANANVGILSSKAAPRALILDNLVRIGNNEVGRASYGLQGFFNDSGIARNRFVGIENGIALLDPEARGNLMQGNLFQDVGTGVVTAANDTKVYWNTFTSVTEAIALDGGQNVTAVVRENTYTSTTTPIRIRPSVRDSTVDARFTDWGTYRLSDIRSNVVNEGTNTVIDVSCYIDSDHTTPICPPTVAFSWPTEPSWRHVMPFSDASTSGGRAIQTTWWQMGDGASYRNVVPTHTYALPGDYLVTLHVDDGEYNTSLTRTVTVLNHAPTFPAIGPRSVGENTTLTFTLSATDADGDTLTYVLRDAPPGAELNATTGTFSWKPNFTQEGVHAVQLGANDTLTETLETVTITVGHTNAPPYLLPVGDYVGQEGQTLRIPVRATDVDAQRIHLAAFPPKPGSTFVDHGNNTATFTWTPDYLQSGTYPLTIEAYDGALEVRENITITILDTNRPPQFAPTPIYTVAETAALEFLVSGSDPDGDPVTFGAKTLPPGATFDATRRALTWVPNYNQAGWWNATLTLRDAEFTIEHNVTIVVTNTNRAPVFDPVPARTVKHNQSVYFLVRARDVDGDAVTYSITNPPANVQFNPSGLFVWRPNETQMGTHVVHFEATDGDLVGTLDVTIHVIANEPPVVVLTAPSRVETGEAFTVSAAGSYDPETSYKPSHSWDFDDADGIQQNRVGATASWTYTGHGPRTVTLRSTDADGVVNLTRFVIVVDDAAHIDLRILSAATLTTGETVAQVTMTLSDGTPVANTSVTLRAYHQPHDLAPPTFERTFTTVTDAAGRVAFVVPPDTMIGDIPGRHVLEAVATAPTSYLDDPETATAVREYAITA